LKIFFCKKFFGKSILSGKIFNISVCVLASIVILSQLAIHGSGIYVQTASQKDISVSSGIVLSLGKSFNSQIEILVNGISLYNFNTSDVHIPINEDCVIEVYNPTSKKVRVDIRDVSNEIKLISDKEYIECKKGITYICTLKKT